MLKILICCGGGFSSSFLAGRIDKEIKEQHLENEVLVDFRPFSIASKKIEEADVVMCCPHLRLAIERFLCETQEISTPLYIMPPRMYGRIVLNEVVSDAQDVIEMYQETHMNPIHFPGEENPLRIRRWQAYRNVKGDYHGYI